MPPPLPQHCRRLWIRETWTQLTHTNLQGLTNSFLLKYTFYSNPSVAAKHMWGPHTRFKNYLTSFGTLQKIHFSTKHRHVPLPARIPSPPRFVPGEFDRTLISQRGGKNRFFLMCVYAPFLLLLLCFLLLRLKRDAKWFIGNIWQLVSWSHLIRATTVVHRRLQVCDLLL